MGFEFKDYADVTVVIPAYNAAGSIRRALKSVAAQTVKPKEVIVVDDGSRDRTVALIEEVIDMEGWLVPIRLFKQANAGAGAARNQAIKQVETTYVAFLDADDEWAPTKLETSLRYLRDKNCTFVAHDIINKFPDGREAHVDCVRGFRRKGNPQANMFLRNYLAISAVVMRTDALKRAGGFDSENRYSLDWECWHAVLHYPGTSFHVFGEPLTTYHISHGALSANIIGRLQCSELYTWRYIHDVKRKTTLPFPLLILYKTALINYEAVTMALKRRLFGRLFLVLLRMPYSFAWVMGNCLSSARYERPDFLKRV